MTTTPKKIVICSGGFDPIHSGHIEYLKAAKSLGDILVVGLNSDEWLERKKGRAFMTFTERQAIIYNLRFVDSVIGFDDSDDSAYELIEKIKSLHHEDKIIFCNGGDRTNKNIPEIGMQNIEFKFEVGGSEKKNSSSWILEDHKNPKTFRPWGYYRILFDALGTKVKELSINPGQSLRLQRHFNRSEYWHVIEGACELETDCGIQKLTKHDQHSILVKSWHRLYNPYEKPCKIIEIQYGVSCTEDDIETL